MKQITNQIREMLGNSVQEQLFHRFTSRDQYFFSGLAYDDNNDIRKKNLISLDNVLQVIYSFVDNYGSDYQVLSGEGDSEERRNEALCYIGYVVSCNKGFIGGSTVGELLDFVDVQKSLINHLYNETKAKIKRNFKGELALGFGLEDGAGIRALHIIPSVVLGGVAATCFVGTILDPANEVAKALDLVAEGIEMRDFFFNADDFDLLTSELAELGMLKLVGLCFALTALTTLTTYAVIGACRTAFDAAFVNNKRFDAIEDSFLAQLERER